MARIILHSDADAFYASVECLYHPELRDLPVAVCGDPAARHGIILAKNQQAKVYGVKTAEAIWQAKSKCPHLILLPAHQDLYAHYSRRLRKIYFDYTDRVEAYGLDENWLDVGGPRVSMDEGERIAHEIRRRVREGIGLTVSIGVSFNKVFAKLGSDANKPDGQTLYSPENFKQQVWPLAVSKLLFVGAATTKALTLMGVSTIGDLANIDPAILRERFGKNGDQLQRFALGLDDAPVMNADAADEIKSIGNSTTPPHDIATMQDASRIFYMLADSVAARLREAKMRAGCISIGARTTDLTWGGCQTRLKPQSALSNDLAQAAISLFDQKFRRSLPMRSLGLSCSSLTPNAAPLQMDIFGQTERRERHHRLEYALDDIRERFGHDIITRGTVLADPAFAQLNMRADDSSQAIAFVMGNRGARMLDG